MANEIDGRTRLVGLLGWPVAHSLSPRMHNAAFGALGLNWRYLPLPARPADLSAAVRGLAALGFCGANVTVPHKEAVIPALDGLTAEAAGLGAVNTLIFERREDGAALITGHNTDCAGFVEALRAGGFDLQAGGRAVVVGAGGAARAVIYGLLAAGMTEVVLLNRTPERAAALVRPGVQAMALTPESLVETARKAALLVNATTVGMTPHPEESIWPATAAVPSHLAVFDLVYAPRETRLLQQARAGGATAIDGLEMLVRQGAAAFSRWTGVADLEMVAGIMRQACLS